MTRRRAALLRAEGGARRRRVRVVLLVLALAVVAVIAGLGVSAVVVRSHLVKAQAEVSALRADLTAADAPPQRVAQRLARVQREARAATRQTDSVLWRAPAAVPLLGRPLRSVAGIATAVDDLATGVLPDVVSIQRTVSGPSLRGAKGSIRLQPLLAAQGPVRRADERTSRIAGQVKGLPATGIGPLDQARHDLTGQLGQVGAQLHTADQALQLLPPMLGATGKRRYFLAFQNNAEARGLGGLPGAYAILVADHGKVSFERFGNDTDFNGVGPVSTKDFGPDYQAQYANSTPGRVFADSNVSPHFPYAAQLWLRYWKAKTGQQLDGALSMDPVALADMLKVTGPTALPDGTKVSADNVVALDREHRLRPVLRHHAAQGLLHRRGAGGRRPHPLARAGDADAAGEVAGRGRGGPAAVGVERDAARAAAACGPSRRGHPQRHRPALRRPGRQQRGRDEARLLPQARPALPGAELLGAATHLDRHHHADQHGTQDRGCPTTWWSARTGPATPRCKGSERLLVSYYATKGAQLVGATLDGKQALLANDTERGHPVFTSDLEIGPQMRKTLVLKVLEPPHSQGPVVTHVQPLVIPQSTRIDAASCKR